MIQRLAQCIHIVRYTGKYLAVINAVKVSQRHAVDFLHNAVAQTVGHLHRNPRHKPALNHRKSGAGEVESKQGQQDSANFSKINAAASSGNFPHNAVEHLRSRLPQHLGADNGKNRGGRCKQHDNNNVDFELAEIIQEHAKALFKILRLFTRHHWAAHRATPAHWFFIFHHASPAFSTQKSGSLGEVSRFALILTPPQTAVTWRFHGRYCNFAAAPYVYHGRQYDRPPKPKSVPHS